MGQDIGYFALNSYVAAEDSLANVLRIIPYCSEHQNVWSPSLVTILLETCSQLDSLWKYTAKKSKYVIKKKLSITDYFKYFGEYVAPKWVVFWGEETIQIKPFEKWGANPPYSENKYEPLDWWDAYNDVKHDRLRNKTAATLEKTIIAIAGLFVTIIWCEYCRDAVAHSGWVNPLVSNPRLYLAEDSPSAKNQFIVVESKLFSYPVGWCKEKISSPDKWYGRGSPRFISWFDKYSNV